MPYQKGKLKGQLTTAEIRKLISAHNKLSKITIPPRSTREQIMDILDKNGFSVDHEKELLVQKTAKKMDINLEKAKEVTKRQPKAQPKPKEVLAIKDKPKEEKKKPVKKPEADKGFKVNRSQRTKLLNEWNDERFGAGLKRVKLHPILDMKASEETPALVKEKCKELRLRYHPDKNNEPDQEKFDMVQRACKILLDTQEILKKSGNDKDVGDAVKKPDEKIDEPPKKKRTKQEISDDRFDNFLVPEINERVVPLLRDWLKNKDDQLYKKIKTFKMWKVPPVKDEDTGAILKKGKKNPMPEYFKEKEKLLKEVKKRFTEIYKKNNFSTRGSAFNNGYNDFVDGVLKGFGSKLFKIEPDEKLQKEMKERRKKEFERKKKEKGE
jgi:uncharacterized small protein (DUF1192 family)